VKAAPLRRVDVFARLVASFGRHKKL
jgi:hypothetical protein